MNNYAAEWTFNNAINCNTSVPLTELTQHRNDELLTTTYI